MLATEACHTASRQDRSSGSQGAPVGGRGRGRVGPTVLDRGTVRHTDQVIAPDKPTTANGLYLELLKGTLTRAIFEDDDQILGVSTSTRTGLRRRTLNGAVGLLRSAGLELVRKRPYDRAAREGGLDWPSRAESMIGLRRMDNLQHCIEVVLREDVPGDLIETGVWRGGATIFMRGVLKVHGDANRTVWVADSFAGLPKPDPDRYPADKDDSLYRHFILQAGIEQVKANFRRYGLLDDQVRFLVGWFKDTLPTAPIDRLAILRLDGDMYESTTQAIEALYPKLSPGGFCIVDDYGAIPACKRAIHDYRDTHGIAEEIVDIDGIGVFWRKE